MNQKTWYIFRHGETQATKTNTIYRDTILTAPILNEDKHPIERMGKFLKDIPTDFNVSSPYLRCKQTVEIIEKFSQKKFGFDQRLGEFNQETLAQFQARVENFTQEKEKSDYQDILICTHGAVISRMLSLILYGKIDNEPLPTYPSPGELLIIKNKKIKIVNFNQPG